MIRKALRLRRVLRWLSRLEQGYDTFDVLKKGDYKHPKVLMGTLLARANIAHSEPTSIHDVEFQVFSQFGDDGIIQYLVHVLPIEDRRFVEFGVENYLEACTRFLLLKDKWSGLVLDGSAANVDFISKDPVSALFNLSAV